MAASTAPRKLKTRRGEIDRATIDSLSQLQLIKVDLEKVSLYLLSNEPKLTAQKRQQWETQLDKVDLAILRACSALMNGFSAVFEKDVSDIETPTGKLADSLACLKKVAAAIDAVADVLCVFEKIITLGR